MLYTVTYKTPSGTSQQHIHAESEHDAAQKCKDQNSGSPDFAIIKVQLT